MKGDHQQIERLLVEIERYLPHHAELNPAVSEASIGWHLEHSILAINGIVSALLKSDPKEFQRKWNTARVYVFAMGKIPRGRGRAPESVKPKEAFDAERTESLMKNIRGYYPRVDALAPQHFFPHPIFGHLRKQKTLKFIRLHTEHHLQIVRDIMRG
jgi:hypothetical protein